MRTATVHITSDTATPWTLTYYHNNEIIGVGYFATCRGAYAARLIYEKGGR